MCIYIYMFRFCTLCIPVQILSPAMAPRPTLAEQAAIGLPDRAWLPGTPNI